MGTSWAEIVTNYAMVEINDQRLTEDMQANPALTLRRMTLYFNLAIPLFNRPPEMIDRLNTNLTAPTFDDFSWVSTEESKSAETEVSTDALGFGLFSCSVRSTDGAGNVFLTPYSGAVYDPNTGKVTFPIQESAGTEYTMDFYSDGEFGFDLTPSQLRIMALCLALVWNERFMNDWLNMQPKLETPSVKVKSEQAHIVAVTQRIGSLRSSLASELRKYEQDCEYMSVVPSGRGPKRFI